MNKMEFMANLINAKDELDKEYIFNVIKNSIWSTLEDGNPRGHRQLIITMEELAELSKEISKQLRGRKNDEAILEEMADVAICFYYLQDILHIDDKILNKAINVKINRLNSFI